MADDISIQLLKADIEMAKGITQLAEAVNKAVAVLAGAILELEDPEGNHFLSQKTREALRTLSETETKERGPSER